MSLSIVAGLAAGGWVAANKTEEYALINILAARDVVAAMPVYAQFNVTQTLAIKERALIKRLILPMNIPANAISIDISLRNKEGIINRWQLAEIMEMEKGGLIEVELPLPSDMRLEGEYALTLDGRKIMNEEQELAPRVFVEKDDGRYADGNYWIASNSKEGDISLRVVAQRYRWQRYWQEGKENPSRAVLVVLAYSLATMILAAAPQALGRE